MMKRLPERRRRRAQATNGLIASQDKRKGSPCQQDDDSQSGEIRMPSLPEDIWCYIHSLMPMRAAARAACVSRAFLHSRRCHPNLTFSSTTLGLVAGYFSSRVDQILKKHSGVGVKKLKVYMLEDCNAKNSSNLDNWLRIAITPGIEELILTLPMQALPMKAKYNFPYSFLSNGSGDSIWNLFLAGCSFCPTAELGWIRSLRKLYLHDVCITGDDLGCALCNSFALEWLEVRYCDGIVCLKVPFLLQRLRYLEVFGLWQARKIDIKAPNISSFCFEAGHKVQLSLRETLQMRNLHITFSGAVHHTRVKFPSSMPNLKTATIYSSSETIDTPILHSKYLHLKKLSIVLSATTFPPAYDLHSKYLHLKKLSIVLSATTFPPAYDLHSKYLHLKKLSIVLSATTFPPAYDYFSLVSFLDACPSLKTFVLNVSQWKMEHRSIFTDPLDLRKMQGHQHHKIKRVEILGFTSAKSLIELTCHIVESITSLERLTLEACQSSFRCSEPAYKLNKCTPLPRDVLVEAQRAVLAIRTYIEPKVPPHGKATCC